MSSSTVSSTIHQNVVPSEVGWQFVPQYYTFVNKQPNRLHCFYTKSSTFVHGTEGEECKPCYGQHEIHEKITSIGFQDCKVFIHSVDAQASANGGIIIQVIGEMSNRGEPWRKFVQTFFLAEQPNGYFVLNDIFRFLKEESVEADDANAFPEPAVSVPESEPAPVPEPPQTVTPAREPTPPPAIPPVVPPATVPSPVPSFTPPVEEPLTNDVPEPPSPPPAPAPQPTLPVQPNGHTPAPEPDKSAPPTVAEKSPVSPPAPLPAPTTAPAAPAPAAPATAAPLAQPAPTAPRSWASLAASNPKKWGSAVAQESRGLTETPVSPAPSSGSKTPTTAAPPAPRGSSNRHEPITTPAIFIKGVTDPLTVPSLRTALSQFGQVQHVEVITSRGCAFAEFASIDSARQAITASHSSQGSGILVEVGQGPPIKVFIEARKERSERPPPRPRGGAPVNGGEGGGRGRHQGGGGAYRGGMRRGAPPAGK